MWRKGTRHGNVDQIISYAFTAEGRKIVIASDGSPTDKLVPLARGADVLVMHPCLPELIDENFGGFRGTAKIVAAHHATAEEVGKTATAGRRRDARILARRPSFGAG